MSKSRFQLPPTADTTRRTPPADPDSPEAKRFIMGDGGQPTEAPAKSKPPAATSRWDQDDDIRGAGRGGTVFNLRLTGREAACLTHISKHTPMSKHQFVISVLRPALAAKIEELTGEHVDLSMPEDGA